MQYNRTLKIKGHVFYDRFHSKIIGDYRQYVATFIYITNNPVKAGIVSQPQDFEFNGVNFMKKGLHDVIDPPDLATLLMDPCVGYNLIS